MTFLDGNHYDANIADMVCIRGETSFWSTVFLGNVRMTRRHRHHHHTHCWGVSTVFFTHCHPHRLMIHAPTFLSELSFDRIPPYLINAICALAAPISRTLRGREAQVRHAGQPFANVALDALFDADRNLVAPFSLATAQTLCLLQAHKTFVDGAMDGDFQFFGTFNCITLIFFFALSLRFRFSGN